MSWKLRSKHQAVLDTFQKERDSVQSKLDCTVYPNPLATPRAHNRDCIDQHDGRRSYVEDPYSPMHLLGICSAWRKFILGTPELWATSLNFGINFNPALVCSPPPSVVARHSKAWISPAGQRSLHGLSRRDSEMVWIQSFHLYTMPRSPVTKSPCEHLIIAACLVRCIMPQSGYGRLSKHSSSRLPVLHTLRVSGRLNCHLEDFVPFLSRHSTQLRVLSLARISYTMKAIPQESLRYFHQLINLELSGIGMAYIYEIIQQLEDSGNHFLPRIQHISFPLCLFREFPELSAHILLPVVCPAVRMLATTSRRSAI
ncbi:hypothetical protein B0H11DRAFT_1971974 [Mycena galericulata]|nr:hypothetical protein B0H11DRAFT_1971974 [Mycena galericulata]